MDRRTLLTRIVQAFSITGLGFFTYPFIKAWIPSFDNTRSRDVDVAAMLPGDQKVVPWLGRNVVLVKRQPEAIEALPISTQQLKDPLSDASIQPELAKNPYRSVRPELFVAFTNCTHLGCEVVKKDHQFKCPCHQSDYDGAGRVLEGAAAPRNLDVPNYRYLSNQLIRLEQLDT
ncbi:MAG: ubiquinol-cytochrome c reductase iron-sulfur subunit [Candidatus Azotimanducaceae bacterium]